MRKSKTPIQRINRAFDHKVLRRVCEMHESQFAKTYGMEVTAVEEQRAPSNFYLHRSNGSKVLAVAHLDTVGDHEERGCHFVNTEAGPVVFSRALDDRLGAYIILELLPALGITYDLLLTVGEEQGQSTAAYFDPDKHEYDWIIEFDRGGTDVVLYDYEDDDLIDRVEASGARVEQGIFSDISYMEHLGIKALNWGVGYQDYHGPRAHAFLGDTFSMVAKYLKFHEANYGIYLPHEPREYGWWGRASSRSPYYWEEAEAERERALVEAEDEELAHGKDATVGTTDGTWPA